MPTLIANYVSLQDFLGLGKRTVSLSSRKKLQISRLVLHAPNLRSNVSKVVKHHCERPSMLLVPPCELSMRPRQTTPLCLHPRLRRTRASRYKERSRMQSTVRSHHLLAMALSHTQTLRWQQPRLITSIIQLRNPLHHPTARPSR